MSVIHISKRENPYVQIDKRVLEDPRLTWRSKGILAYLLSKPSGWKVNVKDIWNNGAEGRNAVQDCLNELREIGYAKLITVSGADGKLMGSQWQVTEEPTGGFSVKTDKPKAGKPINRKSGSRLHSNNEDSLTENQSNNDGVSENKNTPAPTPETPTFKEEKKETRDGAPGRAETVEAQNAHLPKVAQKGISPANCEYCEGYGKTVSIVGEKVCPECNGLGFDIEKAEAEATAENNEAWARITDPKLPGVTVFDGIRPAFPAASPAQWREAAKDIQPWEHPNPTDPKNLKNILLRYAEQNPDNWRDNVLESGKATKMPAEKIDECLTDFCAWQFQQDNTKGKLSQYTAGFSLWLKRQPRFDGMNTPKDGGQRGQNGQQPPSNFKSQIRH